MKRLLSKIVFLFKPSKSEWQSSSQIISRFVNLLISYHYDEKELLHDNVIIKLSKNNDCLSLHCKCFTNGYVDRYEIILNKNHKFEVYFEPSLERLAIKTNLSKYILLYVAK